MISVDEAVTRIMSAFSPLESEPIAVGAAAGRVLAANVLAKLDQPPFPVSSMDGYAVRSVDVTQAGVMLNVIGSAPAGHPFAGRIDPGQAVRIFTGGVVPEGADAIVIQEDTTADGTKVTCQVAAQKGRHIRVAGLDFKSGECIGETGHRLTARDLALIAAGDVSLVSVCRRPKIALVATGDELSLPGAARKPGGIVASSGYALSAQISAWGGEPTDLGILPDTSQAVASIAEKSQGADLIVTLGGASVGDHDLIQKALGPKGFALDFWKIAMRPGKPLIFGRLGKTPLLGLPGNPVSTLVCALLFLKPAIAAMLGLSAPTTTSTAKLMTDLKENDGRQDYVRAKLEIVNGERCVRPFAVQDSSMLSTFAQADALIVRAVHAPRVAAGESVSILLLE